MSLIHIRAHFNCDECGSQFSVGLAADYEPPDGWCLFECAEDAVRGSCDYEDKLQRGGVASSVQDEKHLCSKCTERADEEDLAEEMAADLEDSRGPNG